MKMNIHTIAGISAAALRTVKKLNEKMERDKAALGLDREQTQSVKMMIVASLAQMLIEVDEGYPAGVFMSICMGDEPGHLEIATRDADAVERMTQQYFNGEVTKEQAQENLLNYVNKAGSWEREMDKLALGAVDKAVSSVDPSKLN